MMIRVVRICGVVRYFIGWVESVIKVLICLVIFMVVILVVIELVMWVVIMRFMRMGLSLCIMLMVMI